VAPQGRPVALIILDGWGIRQDCTDNAVCQAATPNLDRLLQECPTSQLGASGMDVGLPDGQMGNSEVGHLNLGAGRIVYQDLTRITKSISDGDFFTNPVLLDAVRAAQKNDKALHLIGLLSDGGVHSHNTHLYALLDLARREGLEKVYVHALLDGRDTPPRSGIDYLAQLEEEMARIGTGQVATVIGRYYAMDRDNRWERVERAYRAMTAGEGVPVASSAEAIEGAYSADQGDEFVEPRVIVNDGNPVAPIGEGDSVIFFNFRADRAREITRSLTFEEFDGFERGPCPQLSSYVCLTEYDATFPLPVAFPPENLQRILGEEVSRAGMRQLRIAETEKYAHVTFFFNGGVEKPFEGEDRVLIPSPKDVATYDLKPSMSAAEVTDEVVARIGSGDYDLIVLNYANPDMVGHTGVLPAAVEAMQTVDAAVGRVVEALRDAGGIALITADHGNCEEMSSGNGQPHTAHTSNPVRLVFCEPGGTRPIQSGILADLAPTILTLLGLEVPEEMTGRNLVG
jgi:2,3-bisphosphoglycerate-independent phosphoglycerate mutase